MDSVIYTIILAGLFVWNVRCPGHGDSCSAGSTRILHGIRKSRKSEHVQKSEIVKNSRIHTLMPPTDKVMVVGGGNRV